MRFLFALIIFIMVLAIVFFAINNVGTTVPVTLVNHHPDLPLIAVVMAAITFGVVFVGIVAITEGAGTRLDNRRLRREIHKLETELNFQRTEPRSPTSTNREDAAGMSTPDVPAAPTTEPTVPTAPVYESGSGDKRPDGDDEPYSV